MRFHLCTMEKNCIILHTTSKFIRLLKWCVETLYAIQRYEYFESSMYAIYKTSCSNCTARITTIFLCSALAVFVSNGAECPQCCSITSKTRHMENGPSDLESWQRSRKAFSHSINQIPDHSYL